MYLYMAFRFWGAIPNWSLPIRPWVSHSSLAGTGLLKSRSHGFGCAGWSPRHFVESHLGHGHIDCGFVHILGQDVSDIFCTKYFLQLDRFASKFILDPEVGAVKVPHLAEALSARNANCRNGIRKDLDSDFPPKIAKQRLQTEGLCSAHGNAM